MNTEKLRKYRFGPFLLDPSEEKLLRDGETVTLTPKAFEALVSLVEKQGRLIEKEELMAALWPDTFVEEANLAHHIWRLRKALNDTKEEERYIETVPKRGYRFVADVSEVVDESNDDGQKVDAAKVEVELESKVPPPISIEPNSAGTSSSGIRFRGVAIAVIILAMLTGSLAFLKYAKSDPSPAPDQPPITSLAVLPFKPLTDESSDPSLQLGMADGVITRLSNLKELTVRPTSAVSRYTAQTADLAAVGRELKVDSILDGTIQRAGDRLRISIQLIRSSDGKPIWAEHFDERATDIFALQDSLSERVARALAIKLTGSESNRLQQHYTADVEAYQSYLKGRYQMNMATDGALKAVGFFQNAIDRDPNFALAYTGLADAYSLLGFVGIGADSPGEQFNKARAAATRALELDDSLADAHTQLANVLFSYDWKWEEAEREFKYAIELNPNSAQAHHLYSEYLQAMTRWDEGLDEIKRAQELDPLSLPINFHYALCLSTMGRDDEALEQYRKTLEIDPNTGASGSHWGIAIIYQKRGMFDEAIRELELAQQADPRPSFRLLNLAQAYARAGRRKEALSNLAQILQIQKTSWVSPSSLAMVYDALGDTDQAFALWNKAIDEREASVVYLKAMPVGDIRKDPRYLDLLKRVGLDL